MSSIVLYNKDYSIDSITIKSEHFSDIEYQEIFKTIKNYYSEYPLEIIDCYSTTNLVLKPSISDEKFNTLFDKLRKIDIPLTL